ncbi:prolyl 4-hydroxylase subunit alpha-1-like [Montipora capricornis]|uniref:prolyl 4-hydroxylase subunit alpha-1-like n=1 Tax=Montipora capricornis TaxID=246305 RepID=UPI0035F1FFDE
MQASWQTIILSREEAIFALVLFSKEHVPCIHRLKMAKWMLLMLWMSQYLSVFGADLFTSLAQLKGLARLEGALSQSLDDYLKEQSEAPQILRQFADHVRKESEIARGNIEQYVFHPINSFQLVRRFVRHWRELDSYLAMGTQNDLKWEIKVNRPAFPTAQDFMGSISALLRIQDVYNLSAHRIANGELHDGNFSGGLGPDECYELGVVSHDQEDYEDVTDWMREALMRMSPPYKYSGALLKNDVLEYLSWAEYQLGLLDEAIIHTKDILDKDPKNEQAKVNLNYFEAEQLDLGEANKDKAATRSKKMAKHETKKKESLMATYKRLCRGESRKQRDKLFCYYNKNLPTLQLKPIKVEMLNVDPDLYLLHDVITDKETEHLKKLAKPQLKRAFVTDINNGNQLPADYRTSQSAWIEDSVSPIAKRISQRLQAFTGLSLEPPHSEPLQVANYGMGGHYEPHFDYVQNSDGTLPNGEIGDRVATVLFYLSDVDAGGSTVFLDIEEFVNPKKGDAVFWYNLDKNGRPDVRTRHAACPVIVGSKWVANKWINERGQEFRRPCTKG